MNGKIKRTFQDKHYGFISVEGQDDVFFHEDACVDVKFSELNEGDAVTFETEPSPKGPKAKDVKRA
jgi:CspA family cold shock protein